MYVPCCWLFSEVKCTKHGKISELVKMQGKLILQLYFVAMAAATKSVCVLVLLRFVIESCPSQAFQNLRFSYSVVRAQAHRVNSVCLRTNGFNPRQFATHRFDVRERPTSLALQSKAIEDEAVYDNSSTSSAHSEIMQEFLSLYQAAIDAGTFIKCTLSANKGKDRSRTETNSCQSTFPATSHRPSL
jgi:hypothetical protein